MKGGVHMDIDFEKIRLDCVEHFKANNIKPGEKGYHVDMIESMVSIASEMSKQMLIKYHEELNKSQD
jgi:hypothetical protein